VGGWLVYDGCVVPAARSGAAFGAVLVVLWSAAAWALCNLFSGRGAFVQFGAMLGTIMVANVFFVIIPGQREMVRAKQEGREPDPQHGIRGKLRSTHNTYFTLPVLFTMISNHYAITYGGAYNWLVLIAISMAGVLIRVYFVSRHKAHERGGHVAGACRVGRITLARCVALTPAGRMLGHRGTDSAAHSNCASAGDRCPALRAMSCREADSAGVRRAAWQCAAGLARAHSGSRAQILSSRHARDADRQSHGHHRRRAGDDARLDRTWRSTLSVKIVHNPSRSNGHD
jgi:uncharacterized membrane protein